MFGGNNDPAWDRFDAVMENITTALKEYNQTFGRMPDEVGISPTNYYSLTEFTGGNKPTVMDVPVYAKEYVSGDRIHAFSPNGVWVWVKL